MGAAAAAAVRLYNFVTLGGGGMLLAEGVGEDVDVGWGGGCGGVLVGVLVEVLDGLFVFAGGGAVNWGVV